MKSTTRVVALILTLAATCSSAKAVLQVTGATEEANQLLNELLGPGFPTPQSANLVSGATSAGFFNGGGSIIGIESGIVLSTGSVYDVNTLPNLPDPNWPGTPPGGPGFQGFESEAISGIASRNGDSDLNAFGGGVFGTQDTTSIEFEFTTDGGDLSVDYVFASDEYNESVGSAQFNDVFAVFVDGVNVALVPGTETPISINTVNNGRFGNPEDVVVSAVNPQYFNNNDPSDPDPDNPGMFLEEFQFDGFTDVLTASVIGLSAGTHTIKFAISDGSDMHRDSAVFLDRLTIATVAPGDFSGDGIVNAADYTLWRDGLTADSGPAGYAAWAANYGRSGTVGSTVPEPTTLVYALTLSATAALRGFYRR